MIKLEKIEQEKVEEFCREIYDELDTRYKARINGFLWSFYKKNKNRTLKELFSHCGDNLLTLMVADYSILQKMYEDMHKSKYRYKKFNFAMEIALSKTSKLGKYLIGRYKDYELFSKKDFVTLTGITVCPYCNRNFINVTPKVNGSQLDHFYSKAQYPIFALSFYNLIPSCASCNREKGEQKFDYSPYQDEIINATFTFRPKSINFVTDVEEFTIEWKDKDNLIAKEREEKLDLLNLYQLHRDVVQELFWKNEIYSDFYKEKIYENFQIGESQIESLITGGYTDEKNYGKRPLSKLVTDISREIGLLREKRE